MNSASVLLCTENQDFFSPFYKDFILREKFVRNALLLLHFLSETCCVFFLQSNSSIIKSLDSTECHHPSVSHAYRAPQGSSGPNNVPFLSLIYLHAIVFFFFLVHVFLKASKQNKQLSTIINITLSPGIIPLSSSCVLGLYHQIAA